MTLNELPDDIDALDAELGALVGARLVQSDASRRCWLLQPTGGAMADRCTYVLAKAEFTLAGHARRGDALILDIVVRATGSRGPLEMRSPFRLYEVLPGRTAPVPARTPCPSPAPDAEGSAGRRRDDMLRRVFS